MPGSKFKLEFTWPSSEILLVLEFSFNVEDLRRRDSALNGDRIF
jgi:hypothetical protein